MSFEIFQIPRVWVLIFSGCKTGLSRTARGAVSGRRGLFLVIFSFGLFGVQKLRKSGKPPLRLMARFLNFKPRNPFRAQVGGTHLATKGGTVAILAQGTSWAVAVTQAFLAAVQIPRVWVLNPAGCKTGLSRTARGDRLRGDGLGAAGFIFGHFGFSGFWGPKILKIGQTTITAHGAIFNF